VREIHLAFVEFKVPGHRHIVAPQRHLAQPRCLFHACHRLRDEGLLKPNSDEGESGRVRADRRGTMDHAALKEPAGVRRTSCVMASLILPTCYVPSAVATAVEKRQAGRIG